MGSKIDALGPPVTVPYEHLSRARPATERVLLAPVVIGVLFSLVRHRLTV